MLLSAISKAVVPVPWSRSDNTLDSSCSTHESSNINIVVDYLLCICTIHSIKFFFNPLSSNTPYRKLPWQMTPLTSSCWMALTFYPTCLLPTHNRKLCSVSTPRHHRSFCAWSPHCSGIRERGNYKICVTENYVQVVGRLLLHPVFNTSLQDPSLSWVDILQVHIHRVRHTHYTKWRMERPGEDFISHSWGDIEATHRQDGLPDPRKNPDSQSHTSLEIHLTLNIKNFNIE